MLITTALLNSMHGIATRRKFMQLRGKKRYYDHQLAFVAGRANYGKSNLKQDFVRHVWIFHGNSGRVHRLQAVDQLARDWEPVMESPGFELALSTQSKRAAQQKRIDRLALDIENADNPDLVTLAGGIKAKVKKDGSLKVLEPKTPK